MTSARHLSRTMHPSRLTYPLLMLALALTVFGVVRAPVAAQETPTEGHPLVGTWILMTEGDGASITTFSSDGTVIDIEASGETGLGSWTASSPTSATATFAAFFLNPDGDTAGSIVIRATLDYDESTDSVTVTYNATGVDQFGTVFFSEDSSGTATRLPVEDPASGGAPLPGLIVVAEATPAA